MATEKQISASSVEAQDIAKESLDLSAQSDSDLFAGDAHMPANGGSQPPASAANDDFYKHLLNSLRPNTSRMSVLQKGLIAGILLIVAILLYVFLKSPPQPAINTAARQPIASAAHQTQLSKPLEPPKTDASAPDTQKPTAQVQKQESEFSAGQPLSLQVAGDLYQQKDYKMAYAAYNQLYSNLSINPEDESLRDFLQLRAALCEQRLGDTEQAEGGLRNVSQSRSPVVNIIANYQLCLLEMQKKQYFKAYTKAYQTLALTDVVTFDREWALSLQKTCNFLVAESITRNVLSLYDADKDLPDELWTITIEPEPFINLNETELRAFLNSGSEQLAKSTLSPQIEKIDQHGTISRWSVCCAGASIEELLARFAANTNLDIKWASAGGKSEFDKPASTSSEGLSRAAPQETKELARKKSIYLYMSGTTPQQFAATAAGCAGLLAKVEDQTSAGSVESKIINVLDPVNITSLSEQKTLFGQEAISLWQRYLLMFHGDERSANAHFAIGLLQGINGQTAEAVAEFKLVANRFYQSPLAPFALLNSSRIKTNLRDYDGARQDLLELVQQHPDTPLTGQAHLYLADATMKNKLYDEAQRIYMKVYNLGFSPELQAAAACGVAKCLYEKKDYQAAEQWLNKYIGLAKDRKSRDVYEAYFLLGKINMALGKPQEACQALQYTLSAKHSPQEYAYIASTLAGAYIEQERFVEALELLAGIASWQLSQQDAVDVLLLQNKVVRQMGLIDNAITTLNDRGEYVSDAQLRAKISFELADCYIAKGNFELAQKSLTEVLVLAEPGLLADQAKLTLADVYLKLGENSQAVSICSQILESQAAAQIKQKAAELMACAHAQEKDYDKAALVLLGKWTGAPAKQE
jgi:tetratricopeptide (TPR) repeat protein